MDSKFLTTLKQVEINQFLHLFKQTDQKEEQLLQAMKMFAIS